MDDEAGMQRAEGAARYNGATRAAARVRALDDGQLLASVIQGPPTSGTQSPVSILLARKAPEARVPVADERNVGRSH